VSEKKPWSIISLSEAEAYFADANRLLLLAQEAHISVFACSLAGVSFIRRAIAVMGGRAEWWINLITSTAKNPIEQYAVVVPPRS
jgi:hypothetical protein